MRRDDIDALCAALRERHPELRRPLTWHGIQRVLRRARVRYDRVPLDVPAMLLTHGGVSVILLNADLPARAHTEAMAHEFAHIQLHAGEPGELSFHIWRPGSADPREREADYLARCLHAGPAAPVDWLLVASHEPAARSTPRRRALPVPPVIDPYTLPIATTRDRPTPRYGGRDGETPLQRALRRVKAAPRPMASGAPSDAEVILYEPGGVVRFVDEEGRRWRVYDVALVPERGVVALGNALARYRVFVNALGQRRKYIFRNKWELRDVAARHFARQLREALDVPVRVEVERRAHSA
jgi:hypothetical protein